MKSCGTKRVLKLPPAAEATSAACKKKLKRKSYRSLEWSELMSHSFSPPSDLLGDISGPPFYFGTFALWSVIDMWVHLAGSLFVSGELRLIFSSQEPMAFHVVFPRAPQATQRRLGFRRFGSSSSSLPSISRARPVMRFLWLVWWVVSMWFYWKFSSSVCIFRSNRVPFCVCAFVPRWPQRPASHAMLWFCRLISLFGIWVHTKSIWWGFSGL